MTKAMKARHGGFTLVELLIVIIIIAILAGMLLLATGSATDSADATKIINDLRNLKGATMMYYVDNNVWPAVGTYDESAPESASLDAYLDRPYLTNEDVVDEWVIEEGTVKGQTREFIGVTLTHDVQAGVVRKLAAKAKTSGVFDEADGEGWYESGNTVYMIMK